jgi:hypothetical protein
MNADVSRHLDVPPPSLRILIPLTRELSPVSHDFQDRLRRLHSLGWPPRPLALQRTVAAPSPVVVSTGSHTD